MKIRLKLFATLRENHPQEQQLSIPDDSSVLDILNAIKINPDEVSIIMVNGIIVDINHILRSADTLSLFPPVGGG
jgi:sulfur-carrier protein